MKYVIPLKPGQAPKDIALGIRLTRIPPVPAAAPVDAPSSPPAEFVLDTFTGTGDLASHVGEIGATWVASPAALGELVLDGAGSIAATAYSKTDVFRASGLPPSPDYSVFATFAYSVGGDPAQLLIYGRRRTDGAYFISLNYDTFDAIVELGIFGPSGIVNADFAITPTAGDHTMELRLLGTNADAYLDGVLLGSLNIADVPDAGTVGFVLNIGSGTLPVISVSEFSAT